MIIVFVNYHDNSLMNIAGLNILASGVSHCRGFWPGVVVKASCGWGRQWEEVSRRAEESFLVNISRNFCCSWLMFSVCDPVAIQTEGSSPFAGRGTFQSLPPHSACRYKNLLLLLLLWP